MPASGRSVPRRGLRSLACAFAVVLALLGGEFAARFQPEASIRFQQAVANGRARLPESVSSVALLSLAGGVLFVICVILVWQAGRPRRPLFLPLALLLCLGSAAFGLFRGGHDVDVERNAALFKGRVGSLERELGALQRKLESSLSTELQAETLRKELEEWRQAASKQLARTQEAQADRDKMAGSLEKSSIAHQTALKERDEVLSALRRELEELKKKLAEKN